MMIRTWWTGFSALWLRECGAANYFIPAVFGTLLVPFVGFIAEPSIQLFAIVFTLSALWMGCCWQLVKLQAQEQAELVPALKQHILRQAKMVLLLGYSLTALAFVTLPPLLVLTATAYATAFGSCFFVLCYHNSHYFRHNSYCFMVALLLAMLLSEHLFILALISLATLAFTFYFCKTRRTANRWHHQAYQVYLNNIQTGWLPSNSFAPKRFAERLRLAFMPLSYFAGNLLVQTCQVFFIAGVLSIVAVYFGLRMDFVVVLLDMLLLMVAIFVCWARLQSKMSWEQLYILPIYSNMATIKRAYHIAAVKLALVLSLYQLLVVVISSSISGWLSLNEYLLLFAGSLAGFLLCVVLGSLLRSTLALSLNCMIVLIVHSAIKSVALDYNQAPLTWALALVYLSVVAALLHHSNKQLIRQ